MKKQIKKNLSFTSALLSYMVTFTWFSSCRYGNKPLWRKLRNELIAHIVMHQVISTVKLNLATFLKSGKWSLSENRYYYKTKGLTSLQFVFVFLLFLLHWLAFQSPPYQWATPVSLSLGGVVESDPFASSTPLPETDVAPRIFAQYLKREDVSRLKN